jgi:hypothetical protein
MGVPHAAPLVADDIPAGDTAATADARFNGADAPERNDGHRAALQRQAPIIVLFAELTAAAVYLAVEARRLWFFGDDWDFLLSRRITHDPIHSLFFPHNEHWVTLPIITFRVLFTIFGVKHYLPYALAVIVLHTALCVVLWFLLRRVGVSPWINVGVVGVMAFLGGGAENTLWDFQITFVGSALFGLIALVLIDRDARFCPPDIWVWVALIASLMCSGMGVPLCVTAFVWACYRRGWRVGVALITVPALAFVVWYLGIGYEGTATDKTPHALYGQVPVYFWTGLTNVFTSVSGIPGSGAVLLIGMVVALFLFPKPDRSWQLAVSGLAGTTAMFFFTGVTRIRFGIDQSTEGRYVYIAAALLLPLLGWALMQIRKHSSAAGVAFAVVIGLSVVNGVYLTHQFAQSRLGLLAGRPQRIIAAEQLVHSGQRLLSGVPDPQLDPDITVQNLGRPDVRAAFPNIAVGAQAKLDAQSYLQVGVSTAAYQQIPPPNRLAWAGVTGNPLSTTGCTTGIVANPHAYVDVTTTLSGSVIQLTGNSTTLDTQLLVDGLTGVTAQWVFVPNKPNYVASVAPGTVLRVLLPASGSVTVCSG